MFKVGDKFIRTKDGFHKNPYNVVGHIGTVRRVLSGSVMCDKGHGHALDCIRKLELEDLLAAAESEVKSLREQIKQRDARPPGVGDVVTYGGHNSQEYKVLALDGDLMWVKVIVHACSSAYCLTLNRNDKHLKVVKRARK